MAPLDLNLLTVFDTLYDQRSVTQAADRLGLTQSAVSHALRRLRDAIGDPLFVRSGRGLQPTARADAMAGEVREGLARLRGALAPDSFDPASAKRRFTIAAGAYFCAVLIPPLIATARANAPGVTIRVVPVTDDLLAALDGDAIDVALGVFVRVPTRLVVRPLFSEQLVWIEAHGSQRSGSDPADRPRLQVGVPRPFGVSDPLADQLALTQRMVSDTIAHRDIGEAGDHGIVYDALTATMVVGATDLIARVPRRVVEADGDRLGVRVLAVDEPATELDLSMLWHRKTEADPGSCWLRDTITSLVPNSGSG